MLLVNKKPLDPADTENRHTKEYLKGIEEIRREYEGNEILAFKQAGFPKKDSAGNMYPIPPMIVPFKTYTVSDNGSKDEWAYCDGAPELLPNGLSEITRKSFTIEDNLVLRPDKDIDFIFYLMRKCKAFRDGMVEVSDPGKDARKRGQEKRARLLVESLIWQTLSDDDELRLVASAWGIPDVYNSEPDAVREQLENELHHREKKRKDDESVKGIDFFVASMKEKDQMRGHSLLQRAVDGKQLTYIEKERRYMIGDAEVLTVPLREADRPFAYLCGYLDKDKKEYVKILRQIITPEVLASYKDYGDIIWLAKLADITHVAKKKEDLKKEVEEAFCA